MNTDATRRVPPTTAVGSNKINGLELDTWLCGADPELLRSSPSSGTRPRVLLGRIIVGIADYFLKPADPERLPALLVLITQVPPEPATILVEKRWARRRFPRERVTVTKV